MKKNYKILLFSLGILFLGSLNIQAQNVWINEIHYDNSGGDVGEFIEVVVENAGAYTLSNFTVTLYNGNNGSSYNSKSLDLFTAGITTNNFTIYYYTFPSNGIQNGAPDGMALDYQGTLITGQFLSYEGTFTGVGGPADGVTSTDIGVAEGSSTQIGESLQLSGSGSAYGDFTWQNPAAETPGLENNGQTLGGALDPEPDNYPTAFVADGSGLAIELTWTDAVGSQLPSGYVIIASDQNNIVAPVDGVALADDGDLSDGAGVMNISSGVEFYAFKHLLSETTYYFEIYPYTNGGANIDYKNDGTPPATDATTDYAINVEYFEVDLGTWTEYSVIGDQVWYQDSYGGSTYAKVSGYSGGSNENEDWLISPALNLDGFVDELFRFSSAMNYSGPDLEVLISEDYDGSSDPNTATWVALSPVLSSGSWAWTESGDVDISAYNGNAVYIAFKYTSTSSNSSTWEIDNIEITGNNMPEITVVAPTVGAQWQVGSSYDIEWTAANTSGNVKIELTTNASGGTPVWSELVASVPAQQQSWTWNIPASQAASPDCKIRITEIDYSVSAESGIFKLIESVTVPDIVITEIMYNPPESGNDTIEFIELYNNDASAVNLEDYYFSDGIEFTFPSCEILPGEYVLVAINSNAMLNTFGVTAYQWTDGGLANGGELIQLVNANGTVVDYVEYDNAEPWPTTCDGNGPSLTLCDPDSDNSLVENWSASINLAAVNTNGDNIYATPGSACVQEPIAEFVADITIVLVDGVVNYTDLSEGSIDTWSWTFDGGTPATSNLQNPPEITYATAGVYTVTLTVENEAGTNTNTKTDYISVGVAPEADFEADNVNILVGGSVNFTDISTGTPEAWEWIFEGGTPDTSSAQNPTSIQYDVMGSYDVILNVTNMFGVSSVTKTDYINVGPYGIHESDLTQFNIYPNPCNGSFFIEFKTNTDNEIMIYSLIGELVYSRTINKTVSEINLSYLNNGIYFIKVYDKNSNQFTTKKLVIK